MLKTSLRFEIISPMRATLVYFSLLAEELAKHMRQQPLLNSDMPRSECGQNEEGEIATRSGTYLC